MRSARRLGTAAGRGYPDDMSMRPSIPRGQPLARAIGLAACVALAGAGVALPGPAMADTLPHTQARLLAGPARAGAVAGGIEIRLAPGWKTYWRYPGDSGVPPQIDWSRARNIAAVEMDFPAPQRFDDGAGGFSIGYKNTVLLPLRITLKDPDAPAHLDLSLDFAVCETLCTLAHSDLSAAVPAAEAPEAAAAEARISTARARLPKPAPLAAPAGPAILAARIDGTATPARLIVDVRAASAQADLFVEGPDSRWALPLPQKIDAGPGRIRFALPLEGVPAGAEATGAALRFTLVDGGEAIVTTAVPASAELADVRR